MKYIKLLSLIFILLFMFPAGCAHSTYVGEEPINYESAQSRALEEKPKEAISSKVVSVSYNNKIEDSLEKTEVSLQELPIKPSKKVSKSSTEDKVVFLTFDDGPSYLTPQFLDVLKKNNVHATFCVIGKRAQNYSDTIRRAYDEGHSVVSHSYNHVFKQIYSSPEAFLASIEKSNEIIDSIIEREHVEKSFLRFPGGASKSYSPIAVLLKSKGYNTLDWNIDSGDCNTGKATKDYIRDKSVNSVGSDIIVLLMHDFKYRKTTLQALPDIIKHYKGKGYVFKTIRDMSPGDFEKLKDKKIANVLY